MSNAAEAAPPAGMPMPTPIPADPNFPVTWADPTESMLHWEREQLHFAHPVSRFTGDLIPMVIAQALGPSLRSMGAPIQNLIARPYNTYVYMAAIPDFERMEGVEERMKASVAQHGFTMYQHWLDTLLPEVETMNQELITTDYAAKSDAQIGAFFERSLTLFSRAWEIHFELMPGFYLAPAFKEACHGMFGFEGLEAYEMMQGLHNLSVESGSKLFHLANDAPEMVKRIIQNDTGAAALLKLRSMSEAAGWLAQFNAYNDHYGWRTGSFDVTQPSWIERPEMAIDQLRLMLRVKSDPADDQKRGFDRGEALANECRAKLAGVPEALGQFNFLLGVARTYPQIQENHNFYIDQKFFAAMRHALLAVGARLAQAGVIAEAGDIPNLDVEEIRSFFRGDKTDRKAAVTQRKAEMEHWAKQHPPLAIGSLPPMENPDPFFKDFFGRSVIEPSGAANKLKGTASSRGSATGIARVVRELSEADRVQEGDILVCEMTTPAWTPLFASLAAIVSDSGGPLSHCAVVAREYGVPCVTGTRIATRTIRDGARITVDGDTGMVTIHG